MVKGLDRDLRAKDRKIVLLVFNCPAHPTIEGLTNIHLVFLPANTTSVFQPMDQGVIRSLKVLYQKRVVKSYWKHWIKTFLCQKSRWLVLWTCLFHRGILFWWRQLPTVLGRWELQVKSWPKLMATVLLKN